VGRRGKGVGGGCSRTSQDVERMQASGEPSLAGESEVRTGQDMERMQAGKGHSPTGEGKG